MEKFFLLIILILSLGIDLVSAAKDDEYNLQNIFKIHSYSYDKNSGLYSSAGAGSAVYLGNGKVVTNAHVVLDSNGLPHNNYELCYTYSFKEKPGCFSHANIEYYDEKKDLALLSFSPINDFAKGVFSQKGVLLAADEPGIGDDVKILGYPGNGGGTITFSEGKISGFRGGLYKTDAYVDFGNSGGGAFNKSGYFIGMPISITVNAGTIGYIIPEEDVSVFTSSSFGHKTSSITNKDFTNFWEKQFRVKGEDFVEFPGYKLENLSKYNFNNIAYTRSSLYGLEYYILQHTKSGENISIQNLDLMKSNISYKDTWDNADISDTKKVIRKYLTVKGKKTYLVVSIDKKTLASQIIIAYDETLIAINGNFKKQKGLIDAVKLILLQSEFTETKKSESLDYKGLNISQGSKLRSYNYIFRNTLLNHSNLDGYSLKSSFIALKDQKTIVEVDGYDNLGKLIKSEYPDFIQKTNLVKNSKGAVYLLSSLYDKELKVYSYFIHKYADLNGVKGYYFIGVDYTKNDKEVFDNHFSKFLNTIEFNANDLLSVKAGKTLSISEFMKNN